MSKQNPKTPRRPRPRVRSSLSAAAVVVWSVLWVVGGIRLPRSYCAFGRFYRNFIAAVVYHHHIYPAF